VIATHVPAPQPGAKQYIPGPQGSPSSDHVQEGVAPPAPPEPALAVPPPPDADVLPALPVPMPPAPPVAALELAEVDASPLVDGTPLVETPTLVDDAALPDAEDGSTSTLEQAATNNGRRCSKEEEALDIGAVFIMADFRPPGAHPSRASRNREKKARKIGRSHARVSHHDASGAFTSCGT
jgi:hypothetical protein